MSETSPEPFPWDAAMAAGFLRLRLAPDAFWAMTPRELAMAAGAGRPRPGPMSAEALAALMARYPDEVSADHGPAPHTDNGDDDHG